MRFSRPALVSCLLFALVATGCGTHGSPTQAGALAARSGPVRAQGTIYSQDDLDRYAGKIQRLVAAYDHDGDGAIAPAESPVLYLHDHTDSDRRFDDDWILRTRVYFDRYRAIKATTFATLDTNHDGRLSTQELVLGYLMDRDTNQDGTLGIWERAKALVLTPSNRFETKWVVETGRSQWFVYQPVRDADARNRSIPAPPPLPAGDMGPALSPPPDPE